MPVARIFTSHPEKTESLSRQLQSQGYTVEVVAPNAAVSRPAELEIDFEIWPEDSVLERAAELAEELHADVAVEPGVGLSSEGVAPQAAPSSLAHEDLLRQQPQPQPIAQSPAPQCPVELQPQEAAADQPPTHNTAAEPPLPPLPPANELAPEPAYATEQHESTGPQHVSVMKDQDSPPALAGLAGELWTTASQTLKEAAERSRIFLAESNVRREQKLLELTERKAQAQERANELHAARQAASARLQELVRMGGTEPLPASPYHLDEAEEEHAPTSPSAFALVRERVNEWWRMLLGRRYSPQVQAILTGVAAIMALFVLAMAIASLRPRPALSNSLDTNYKGVTVKTGGATVTPAPAKSPATRPSPVVIRNAPNTGKQSPAHRAGDSSAVPQSDSGDVSVRHLKGQAPAPKPAAKNTPQPNMKRITDLDN